MYNRREFLAQAMWLAVLPGAMRVFLTHRGEVAASTEFIPIELQILAAAVDEIIPTGDGMPSATGSGGLQYLRYLGWQYPDIEQEITRFLKALARAAAAQFGADFPNLKPDQRVQLLATVEKNQASLFSTFVSYVYEGYYTRPEVVGLIACAPPSLSTEDDETLLAPLRKRSHLYREVP